MVHVPQWYRRGNQWQGEGEAGKTGAGKENTREVVGEGSNDKDGKIVYVKSLCHPPGPEDTAFQFQWYPSTTRDAIGYNVRNKHSTYTMTASCSELRRR